MDEKKQDENNDKSLNGNCIDTLCSKVNKFTFKLEPAVKNVSDKEVPKQPEGLKHGKEKGTEKSSSESSPEEAVKFKTEPRGEDNGSEEGSDKEDSPSSSSSSVAGPVELEPECIEGENIIMECRAKLFRFNPEEKEWKERGVGEIRLLQSLRDPEKCRVTMWRDGNGLLACNFRLFPSIRISNFQNNPKALCWTCFDNCLEEPQWETFTCKFATEEKVSMNINTVPFKLLIA